MFVWCAVFSHHKNSKLKLKITKRKTTLNVYYKTASFKCNGICICKQRQRLNLKRQITQNYDHQPKWRSRKLKFQRASIGEKIISTSNHQHNAKNRVRILFSLNHNIHICYKLTWEFINITPTYEIYVVFREIFKWIIVTNL